MYKWDSKKTIKVDTFWEINMQSRFHPTVIFNMYVHCDVHMYVLPDLLYIKN